MSYKLVDISGVKIAEVFGDSNTAWPTTGLSGVNHHLGWQYQYCNKYNIFPYNRAAGSTGYFTAVNNCYQFLANPSPVLMLVNDGYNDVKVFTTNIEGIEHAKSAIRAMLCNQFLASAAIPASDASVSKTGSWSTESITTSKANRTGGTPMKSSTAGDKISFDFTGTNVVVFTRHSDGTAATYGSVRVTIDGNPATITGNASGESSDEYSMNNKAYNVTTSGGFIFGAFQVKGLSNGAHTIELELLENQTTIIDAFGTLADPSTVAPAIIGDITHDNTATSGRNDAIDALNVIIRAMTAAEFPEYIAARKLGHAPTNDFVDEADTIDDVHFDLAGHTAIAAAFERVTIS